MTKRKKKQLTAISLFSGAGGLDIGFQRANFDIRIAVEIDPSCCDTLRQNLTHTKVIQGDLTFMTGEELCKLSKLEVGTVDCVFGGPPCQSFSLAGNRRGLTDPRGELIFHFIRLIKEIKPKSFVIENVKGMLNWQKGAVIDFIEDALSKPVSVGEDEQHYFVQHKLLDAVDFGVAQRRERIFIVGNRVGKNMNFPTETHANPDESVFDISKKPYATVGKVLSALPPPHAPSATALRVSQTIKGRRLRHGY